MKYLITCLIVIFVFSMCTKIDIPEPKKEEPTFYINFSEDGGLPVNLAAGQEDYYMYTSTNNVRDVQVFSGELRPRSCSQNCGNSISFHIRNNHVAPAGTAVDISKSFEKGPREYYLNPDYFDSVQVSLVAQVIASTSTDFPIVWEASDLPSSKGPHRTIVLHKNEHKKIWISAEFSDHCMATAWRTVALDSSRNCRTIIAVQSNQRVVRLTAKPTGTPPFEFEWSTGQVTEFAEFSVNDQIRTSVTVTDANGCQSGYSIKLKHDRVNGFHCPAIGFEVKEMKRLVVGDDVQLGRAKITYINQRGNLFSTALGRQPKEYAFVIKNVSDFRDNERGEGTKLLEVEIYARLYNEQGKHFDIKGAEANIAVAYPKR